MKKPKTDARKRARRLAEIIETNKERFPRVHEVMRRVRESERQAKERDGRD